MPTIGEEKAELRALGIYDDYIAELRKGNIIAMSTFKNNIKEAKKAPAKPAAKAKATAPVKEKKAAVKKAPVKNKKGKKK